MGSKSKEWERVSRGLLSRLEVRRPWQYVQTSSEKLGKITLKNDDEVTCRASQTTKRLQEQQQTNCSDQNWQSTITTIYSWSQKRKKNSFDVDKFLKIRSKRSDWSWCWSSLCLQCRQCCRASERTGRPIFDHQPCSKYHERSNICTR